MEQKVENKFWQFDGSYWLEQLKSSEEGLSQAEATKRIAKNNNALKNCSALRKDLLLFFNQFKSPLMLMLIGAVIISGFLGDTSEVFIILFIVLSTGLLSFFQERNAGKVVEKLQALIAIKTTVFRDGKITKINANQIVAGDIISLTAGDILPADCILLTANELYVNESSLTGESYPVRKEIGKLNEETELSKRSNSLWEGTNIISGEAKALVIQTGENSLFGHIAKSASIAVELTFEKGIKDFGYFLMKITLVLALFILIVNLLNQKSIMESALFALALAVGMAPELLPAIATIAMSAGAKKLLEKKVIVKKLNSIQNLGEVNLLCTDKTGTITEGSIKIAGLINYIGQESEWIKKLAYWNASNETGYSNPIDEALKNMKVESEYKVSKIGEVPYDFIRKRLSIAIQTDSEQLLISKGAFSQIKSICNKIIDENNEIQPITLFKKKIDQQFQLFGEQGFRVIAICYKPITADSITKEDEIDMIFAGFILMNDPIKKGIIETINELHQLKVGLKIITGDNKNIALSIAKNIGIKDPIILTGKELLNTNTEALKQLVKRTHIFAEVEPQQKERIILALKHSYTVAYMGDGINDVGAINAADVGISVDNAVDVAKEAADFVLMEKELIVIAEGIKQGRKTFANTMKYLYINTGATFGNMFSVAVASLLLPFLPMLPKQILLTNFLTDFPYLSIANDNVDLDVYTKPGKWNIKIIRNYMIIFGIHSSIFDILTFVTLFYILKAKEATFQTGWFIESVLTELCILFIIRTHRAFIKSQPGKYLFLLSMFALILTIMLPYLPFAKEIGLTPLPLINLGLMLGIVLFYILTADILKVWFFKKYKQT